MILNIIFTVCMYPVLPIVYFVMKSSQKPNNKNIVLGVTLPGQYLEDSNVLEICKQFVKEMKRYAILLAVLPVSFFFIPYFSIVLTLWMIWLLGVISMSCWPYIKYYKKMRNLKMEKQWNLDNSGKTMVDLKAASEKIRAVKLKYILPPVILSGIPFVYEIFQTTDKDFYFVKLIILFSIVFVSAICLASAILMDRQKTEVISRNSDININFNRAKKHIWASFWVWISWLNTALIFAVWMLMEHILHGTVLFMIATIVYSVIIICLSLHSCLKINKVRQRAILEMKEDSDQIQTDDDANWIYGMMYYNPNDSTFMVDKRIGIGSTVNMANSAAKWITGIIIGSLLLVPLISVFTIFEEFTPIGLEVSNNQIIAQHIKKEYTINLDDIKATKLITKLPSADRLNGTGMDTLEKGIFDVKGYGHCKLCLNPQNTYFIVVKANGNTYIFSDRTDSGTRKVYSEMKK